MATEGQPKAVGAARQQPQGFGAPKEQPQGGDRRSASKKMAQRSSSLNQQSKIIALTDHHAITAGNTINHLLTRLVPPNEAACLVTGVQPVLLRGGRWKPSGRGMA